MTRLSELLPARDLFPDIRIAYLDSATQHPVSVGARDSAKRYLEMRSFAHENRGTSGREMETRVRGLFARLINARPEDIACVASTMAGEQLVLRALGLDVVPGRIVTDTLHFPGSFYLYDQLARRGADVCWVSDTRGRISLEDMERAIVPGTRLVALSWISGISGFEHDLARICEMAHSVGALVYADIIQGVGAVPLDVAACGVDFAACSSFKWLMGDFGVGLLYVRPDRIDALTRTQFGYYQLASFGTRDFPVDPPSIAREAYEPTTDANGLFATGTLPHIVLAQLEWSLNYILNLGVDMIEAYRRPLIDRLKDELPRLGFRVMTPSSSRAPIVTCALDGSDAVGLDAALKAAGVHISVGRDRFRVAVSVFNDDDDVDRLLAALAGRR